MILHDFIYEWDGKTNTEEKPVAWSPGSYHVKIVKLSTDKDNVSFLISYAVLLKNARINTTMNTSLKNYIHNFAQKISSTYNLDMKKTLWVEIDDTIQAIWINSNPKLEKASLYDISWRPIRPNELSMIEPYLSDM